MKEFSSHKQRTVVPTELCEKEEMRGHEGKGTFPSMVAVNS